MPAPKLPKGIGVKVPNATIGEVVTVRNLTNGRKLTGKVAGTDRSVNFTDAPTSEWNENDKVQAEITGRISGVASGTIQGGGVQLVIDASTDTTTPGVTL